MSESAQMNFITQYVKDVSFENPNAPESFKIFQQSNPKISFDIDLNVKKLKDDDYEIEMKITADAKSKEDENLTLFIAEVKFAGIFLVKTEDKELLQKILLIECPTLLFPFLRRVIADLTRDGGFPPLLMNPMNFHEMYEKNKTLIN